MFGVLLPVPCQYIFPPSNTQGRGCLTTTFPYSFTTYCQQNIAHSMCKLTWCKQPGPWNGRRGGSSPATVPSASNPSPCPAHALFLTGMTGESTNAKKLQRSWSNKMKDRQRDAVYFNTAVTSGTDTELICSYSQCYLLYRQCKQHLWTRDGRLCSILVRFKSISTNLCKPHK